MSMPLSESAVESALLSWFGGLGYRVGTGESVVPGGGEGRGGYEETALLPVLRAALARLNPGRSDDDFDEALRRLFRTDSPSLVRNNAAFHALLVDGVPIERRLPDGSVRGDILRVVDFDDPEGNDWLAASQFTVQEGQHVRRADVVVFLNGLPVAVFELKNPADEGADIWKAFAQLQTYKAEVPSLFLANALLVVSDGLQARVGTLTGERERFAVWRTITGEDDYSPPLPSPRPVGHPSPKGRGEKSENHCVPRNSLRDTRNAYLPSTSGRGAGGEGQKHFKCELEVLLLGVFEKRRFLEILRHFVVFEDDGKGKVEKKVAGYHQFHAVRVAVEKTVEAAGARGDRRCGVVWHTQGSGKSLTMVFYAGELVLHPAMENPTLVVLTDRNDLDDQLFGTFSRCAHLLRQRPVQAESRPHLRSLLSVASGGVVFTTIQKFLPETRGDTHPELSARRNVVVIADEAHRSQYDFVDGYAKHMRDALPKASFIGFTGTPIEKADANTRAVFGDYISVYDIQRAVEDSATVPIFYESRLAKLALLKDLTPQIDAEFEEVTEGEEEAARERAKTRWTALEAVVGSEKRLRMVAADLVEHWEARLAAMEGKAMVVCMSRRICMDLHDELVRLRPGWFHADDDKGVVKVVMTGGAQEGPRVASHARTKERREKLADLFRNPATPFRIVIVRDMWLTGFDAPCLHTMYVDKPMRGHGLMQAIARVNRVFRDKPGGLVVDYLGIADSLRRALATYTESGGTGKTAVDQAEAVEAFLTHLDICRGFLFGFEWREAWLRGTAERKLGLLPSAQEHVLRQQDGKARFTAAVGDLSKAFALAVPAAEVLAHRDEVAFCQAVRAALAKARAERDRSPEEIEHAVRQLVEKAIAPEGVIDVFAAAGLKKPDISVLSEEFLAEVRGMPQRNLAVELLQALLKGELRTRTRKNLVQSQAFSERLEKALLSYQNRAVETARVIEELIALARDMREAQARGERLGMTDDELAFYDALETNDSAVAVLGDETLRKIARELLATVRKNATIDWTVKESVRAGLRALVRRILRKYGYPPDKQERATQTVLEQAALLCGELAG
jgi:type I restriction enzyme R subunit